MSSSPRGMLVSLLQPNLSAGIQLEWAAFLAAARKMDLLVLLRMEDGEDRVDEVDLVLPVTGETPAMVREMMSFMEGSTRIKAGPRPETGPENGSVEDDDVVFVQLRRVHYSDVVSLRRQVLAEIRACDAETFTMAHWRMEEGVEAELVKERRRFLRFISCEAVICLGLEKWHLPSRFLVPVTGESHGKTALILGRDLASNAGGTLTALQVNPQVGLLAAQVGERRLDRSIDRAFDEPQSLLERRVVVNNQPAQGVSQVWEEGNHDLMVVSLPRSQVGRGLVHRFGKGVPVVMVIPGSRRTGRLLEIFEDTVSRFVPQIERSDRVALVDRFQSSAAWNFDFLILMVLSSVIAAVGLMQNSAAVVIGAMLVAPLMTPLLGLGLGIEQGNAALARLALGSLGRGIGVSLLAGFLVGFLTPGFDEPTREMLSRGGPGVLDLVVAYVAGIAAAYASTRPSLIAALPGVAIAAALVPPIATSGLALALGEWRLAIGALLLFGINMVTIVLASMTSLWAVGIRNPGTRARWLQGVGVAIIISVLGLGLYLGIHESELELTEEIPPGLMAAIQTELGTAYKLEELAVAYDELGVQLHVSVVGRSPAPEELATEVRNVAGDHYDHPVRVRLLTRIAVDVGSEEVEVPK